MNPDTRPNPFLAPRGTRLPARNLRRIVGRRLGLKAWSARLKREESGVAAVEFAFIAPIMLLLLIGIIDISNAVSLNWRMVHLNRTLADISSQSLSLSSADVGNIFAASASVMSPHKGPLPRMTISSVVIGADRKARVCWSVAREGLHDANLKGREVGSIVPVPNNTMAAPNTSFIVTSTSLRYEGYLWPDFEMVTRDLFFRPRTGNRDTRAEQVVMMAPIGTGLPCAPA